jgi:hypothetical protein
MDSSPYKQPAALLPLGMSLAALTLVLGHAAIYGIVHEADEGAAAHVFQFLMVAQVPFILMFAFKWLPRAPLSALRVLAMQAGAIAIAFVAVYFLT